MPDRITPVAWVLFAWAMALPAAAEHALWRQFSAPPASARPWVVWYWMNGNVSPEGITADLQAMKHAGIGGAYLMPVEGPNDPPDYQPPATQLSPRFWQMVRHAAREANRLEVELGVHVCDGWSVAGGPWIEPALSMQKLVWTRTEIDDSHQGPLVLPQPETNEGYYRDIAVVAFPTPHAGQASPAEALPSVRTSDQDPNAVRLADAANTQRYRSSRPCWIEYRFAQPQTFRSVTITPDGNNYQCQRLKIVALDADGARRSVTQLNPPRHGWQEEATPVTHALPATTARAFRFEWDPVGSEPGAEDLDSAKWSPVLKVKSIVLSSQGVIASYRGKSGALWRRSGWGTEGLPAQHACVPSNQIVHLSELPDKRGRLQWRPPAGRWTVMRLGHTSTGRRNAMGGGAKGLECDKLNPAAVRLQLDRWFGELRRKMTDEIGADAVAQTLTALHLDSWECGSQNWTPGFRQAFEQQHGYDLTPYLPCMAGIPVNTPADSERALRDVRATINHLLQESFFKTVADEASRAGVQFTGECTAPTMVADGMQHYAHFDVPMGEFWLNTPTHDKPNDMLDAISGAHIYGKRVIAAEAFTQLRIGWDETPQSLKMLGDRNLALGANRLAMHVWAHNPWLDRKPGQLLGGVGLYFQRDQPWITAARGWTGYLSRTQALLQAGRPVADIAVWTGDDLPRRAILPQSLTRELPGLLGQERTAAERERVRNAGLPLRELPVGVRSSANTAGPDPMAASLGGYRYDSINSDAIQRLAAGKQGRLRLSTDASYGLLLLPAAGRTRPNAHFITAATAERLATLVEQGVTVLCAAELTPMPSLGAQSEREAVLAAIARMRAHPDRFLEQNWTAPHLRRLGIAPDVQLESAPGNPAPPVAWTHREGEGWDLYFFSNQSDTAVQAKASLRAAAPVVQVWDPVTGDGAPVDASVTAGGRTELPLGLEPRQSLFVVLSQEAAPLTKPAPPSQRVGITGPWRLTFDPAVGARPAERQLDTLRNLTEDPSPEVRHFAGRVTYCAELELTAGAANRLRRLVVHRLDPLAEVRVNGQDCGVLWAAPWRVEVGEHLAPGVNRIELVVPSTWKNALVRESGLPEDERCTWTSAPLRLQDKELTPYGLRGDVWLE